MARMIKALNLNPEKRLKLFWGKVDQKHINSFMPFLKSGKVLDLGCGMGSTSDKIRVHGDFEVVGIDYAEEEVKKAQALYPKVKFITGNAENLPFESESFDTIVLKDSLHHFYEEADFGKVSAEILRVLKKGGRVVFFDPNVNFMIKYLRSKANHIDAECDFESAISIMESMNLNIVHRSFNTIFSLPLSGGYVYKNYVPHNRFLYKFLITIEQLIEFPVNWFGFGRFICWRYLIVGEK